MNRTTRFVGWVCISASCALAARLGAQTLSDPDIQKAIQLGQSKQEIRPPRVGRRASLVRSALAVEIGQAYTPDLRIALAARAARDAYRSFTANDVTREMLEPLVYVQFPPQDRRNADGNAMNKYVDVEDVLVMPKGSSDPTSAIRPEWIKESAIAFTNIFGAQWEAKGLVAAFPLRVLDDGNEFIAIYKDRPMMGGGASGREIRGTIVDRPKK